MQCDMNYRGPSTRPTVRKRTIKLAQDDKTIKMALQSVLVFH